MKKLLKKHFSFIIAVLMVISLIIIPRTAQAASVKLNKTKLTMNVGGVYHLKVSGTNKKVTWSSTDSKVASVSSGKVKAKKTGTATITAKIGSKKLKCQIKIKDQRALYEKVLLQSGGKCFYLMDIDRNGTPDLIVSSNRGVIVDYSVYTIKNGKSQRFCHFIFCRIFQYYQRFYVFLCFKKIILCFFFMCLFLTRFILSASRPKATFSFALCIIIICC